MELRNDSGQLSDEKTRPLISAAFEISRDVIIFGENWARRAYALARTARTSREI